MRFWSRETRLLVVTVVLSVIVLLALARLRFPRHEPVERLTLPARPLQQLADRAVLTDVGAALARVSAQVRPALRRVRLAEERAPVGVSLADVLLSVPRPTAYAVAIHVGDGRYVALAGPSATVIAPDGFTLERRDVVRQVAVFAGPRDVPALASSRPSLPSFLVMAEPTAGGISLGPMFASSADTVRDPRWDQPVLALGSRMTTPGALVFSLEGAFAGGVVDGTEGRVLVPAEALLAAADRASGASEPRSAGLHLQALDASLRTALGADRGAVVAAIDPGGPADGRLEPADVVRAVDGVPVNAPADLLLRLAVAPSGAPVDLEVIRRRAPVSVRLDPAAPRAEGPAEKIDLPARSSPTTVLGATLASGDRGVRVTGVVPGGAASLAGLRTGDQIRWIQGTRDATVPDLLAAWKALPPGGYLAVGVDREAPIVLALMKP